MSRVKRKIIEIDEERCDGCGQCVPACAEGAIQVIDGKAKLIADKFCDGLGACLGDCPNDALLVVERDADEFDEEAVEEHLKTVGQLAQPQEEAAMPCGCPSSQIQSFEGQGHGCPGHHAHQHHPSGVSALSHWPVQIHLIPPEAPFLKGADLLVLADCVAAAYPNLHQDLMPGKTVLMGCPKLDDAEFYIQRFTDIFKSAGLKSITIAMMEVPCCSGMAQIVKEAMKAAGVSIPVEQEIISVRGESMNTAERSA